MRQATAESLRLKAMAPFAKLQARGLPQLFERSDPYDLYIYALTNIVYNAASKFQHILVADTVNFGRALILDGHIQSTKADETLYHEMLVQPAMLAHPRPEKVLIIGGGEGASLREVLVHSSVKKAVMVDIDGQVVDVCKEHLIDWHRGAFDDPRTELVVGDGRAYVFETEEKFDVVIIDVVDMLSEGPAKALYTTEFYQRLKECLNPQGLLVVQGMEYSIYDKGHFILLRTLKSAFKEVHSYTTVVPSFLASWGFAMASDWFDPSDWQPKHIDSNIDIRIPGWLKHLDGAFFKSTLVHSKYARFLMSLDGPIVQDKQPYEDPRTGYEEDIDHCMKFPLQ